MPLPPIPSSVSSVLGPVAVTVVDGLLDDDGEVLLGRWLPEERRIELRAGMHPTTMLVTLWHEKIHLYLWDSGAKPMDDSEEERICDALSVALVAEMMGDVLSR
jgi:hypothetical protein